MKKETNTIVFLSIALLIYSIFLTSCKEDYSPIPTNSKSCNIEIECVGPDGKSLLTDKSFSDKISVEGDNSHTKTKFTIKNNRVCFEADIPDQNDLKWSKDHSEATGISKMTVKFGKQKVSIKCLLKYTANRPPMTAGGTITLEEVEYNAHSYKRTGNVVLLLIRFNKDGKLQ